MWQFHYICTKAGRDTAFHMREGWAEEHQESFNNKLTGPRGTVRQAGRQAVSCQARAEISTRSSPLGHRWKIQQRGEFKEIQQAGESRIHRSVGVKWVLWRPHEPGKNAQKFWTLFHMAKGRKLNVFLKFSGSQSIPWQLIRLFLPSFPGTASNNFTLK